MDSTALRVGGACSSLTARLVYWTLILTSVAMLGACQSIGKIPSSAPDTPTSTEYQQWIDESKKKLASEQTDPAADQSRRSEQVASESSSWRKLIYSVELQRVPLSEVLNHLARDAQLALLDSTPRDALVTLTANRQPLEKLLLELEKQCPHFIDVENGTLMLTPNLNRWRSYPVDYPHINRQTKSRIQTSLQLSVNSHDPNARRNHSSTEVNNSSENSFWQSTIASVEAIISKGSTDDKDGDVGEKATVIAHTESGRLMVYANRRQHRAIGIELRSLLRNVFRQVLIEATVVEIELTEDHKNGLDWQALLGRGWRIWQQSALPEFQPSFAVQYSENNNSTQVMLNLLEGLGNIRVVSQPKLIALNNQSAVLKVVDERVYFTTEVENTLNESTSSTSFQTTIHSIPVGFTMTITPWIGEQHQVILSLKPSLTRIIRMVADPNPSLAQADVTSMVPELQIREMETVMRLKNGQIGVIGGLIQESDTGNRSGVPGLQSAPGVGWLFGTKQKNRKRSELIIMLRPVIDSS